MFEIEVRTINDKVSDFEYLFDIIKEISDHSYNVRLDFSKCDFLGHNATAILGSIIRLSELKDGKIEIKWDTLQGDAVFNLLLNGFFSTFNGQTKFKLPSGNAVPFREDKIKDSESVIKYLQKQWLDRGWVNISTLLKNEIVGKMWETYDNAFSHSQSPIGVISCGQYYDKDKLIELIVVDLGISIPTAVRNFKSNPKITSDKALAWSFQRGATTKTDGMSRGLGLELLKQFVKVNKGRLEVYSLDGYALIDSEKEHFSVIKSSFPGTIINITLRSDESYYYLSSEKK